MTDDGLLPLYLQQQLQQQQSHYQNFQQLDVGVASGFRKSKRLCARLSSDRGSARACYQMQQPAPVGLQQTLPPPRTQPATHFTQQPLQAVVGDPLLQQLEFKLDNQPNLNGTINQPQSSQQQQQQPQSSQQPQAAQQPQAQTPQEPSLLLDTPTPDALLSEAEVRRRMTRRARHAAYLKWAEKKKRRKYNKGHTHYMERRLAATTRVRTGGRFSKKTEEEKAEEAAAKAAKQAAKQAQRAASKAETASKAAARLAEKTAEKAARSEGSAAHGADLAAAVRAREAAADAEAKAKEAQAAADKVKAAADATAAAAAAAATAAVAATAASAALAAQDPEAKKNQSVSRILAILARLAA